MDIIRRADWGARAPRGIPTMVAPNLRTKFMVHYSTGQELGREDTAEWVRQIQSFHQDVRGWADIGYNFLVDRRGRAFEGRGWDVQGAHCTGQNVAAIGVCFLGNDDPGDTDATPAARAAIRAIYDEAVRRLGHDLAKMGHRDAKATTCPGDELYDWVRAGMPIAAPVSAAPSAPPKAATRNITGTPTRRLTVDLIDLRNATSRNLIRHPGMKPLQRLIGVDDDGLGGPATRAALGRKQAAAGVRRDYIFGPKTAEAILAGKAG